MRRFFAALFATPVLTLSVVFLLSSCRFLGGERVSGDGHVVTRQRNIGSFNSLDVGGALEVRIRQDATASVRVETDENLQEYVETYLDGSTLVIHNKQGYNLDPSKDIIIYVSAPEWKDLDVSGSSKLMGENTLNANELGLHVSGASEMNLEVKTRKLETDMSGSSSIQLRGSAETASSEVSGASHLRCLDLQTNETTLEMSGASDAEVTAEKQLNVEASGASHVRYRGNANIDQKSSGASSVEKM
ncbi:MAG TPA: head GIN domain-containing protein [Flavisolibacter sp.]|nr:head GIN domain-containing protein [Flavisolibacter sp.]